MNSRFEKVFQGILIHVNNKHLSASSWILIRFLSWVLQRALLLEVKVIKYTFSKAAWTSSLGTAVVIGIFIPLLPRIFIYFSSSQYLCTEVVGSYFVVSNLFIETVLERRRCTNRMKSTILSFEYTC